MPEHYVRPTDGGVSIVRITPPAERLNLHYQPAVLRQGGVGNWIERPHDRAKSSTEWVGQPLHYMTLRLFFDRDALYSRPNVNGHIERELSLLHSFGLPTRHGGEPPVLRLTFGHGQQLSWVLRDVIHRTSELDPRTKRRVQAEVDVDLMEYRRAVFALSPAEKAEEAAAAAVNDPHYVRPDGDTAVPAAGARTYTVRAGDTLSTIAARELGSPGRFMEIFNLNTPDPLSNPDHIVAGQVLRLPEV